MFKKRNDPAGWLTKRLPLKVSDSIIRKVFPIEETHIDEQTSKDLLLNEYFNRIDKSITRPGRNTLFYLLHAPKKTEKEIADRASFIEMVKGNELFCKGVEKILFRTRDDGEHSVDAIMLNDTTVLLNRFKKLFLFGLFLLLVVLIPILLPKVALFSVVAFLIISFINFTRYYKIFYTYIPSLIKLSNHYKAAKNIMKAAGKHGIEHVYMENLSESIKKLEKLMPLIGVLQAGSLLSTDPFGLLLFWVKTIFCIDLIVYNRVIGIFKDDYGKIAEFYFNYGLIDALLSVKKELESGSCMSRTEFGTENRIELEQVYHPLLDEPVKNDLRIEDNIILTGSNMSGKSTLLRTIGINCILSQVFGYNYSDSSLMPVLNVKTIINKHDDMKYGESFYYYEASRISKMINRSGEGISLFLVDELLSGTNSIERISASIAIISYLNKIKSIKFVIATHDISIAEKQIDNCECYYLADTIIDNKMTFNYKLKKGIIKTTNAIKMLESVGLPPSIIEDANGIKSELKCMNII